MEATVLERALTLVMRKMQRENPDAMLPRTIVIGIDNTPREGKNQWFAEYCAHMKAEKKADIIETEFLLSGHSHNEMDQRFSSVAVKSYWAPSLDPPGEFRDWILKEVAPARGRELHVEVLEGTWDVRTWLHDADVHIKGLAATHK